MKFKTAEGRAAFFRALAWFSKHPDKWTTRALFRTRTNGAQKPSLTPSEQETACFCLAGRIAAELAPGQALGEQQAISLVREKVGPYEDIYALNDRCSNAQNMIERAKTELVTA